MSTAYLIARVEVTDPQAYQNYTARTPDAVAAFDGRFLVRGGKVEALEGPSEARRIVVIEFPSMDRLKAFFASVQYQEARSFRLGAAVFEAIAVEGA
jgi:uncharacterized protein (DUF1330 family)